nr:flagellar hook-length control protein FliK [Chromobacterium sp. ASV5]
MTVNVSIPGAAVSKAIAASTPGASLPGQDAAGGAAAGDLFASLLGLQMTTVGATLPVVASVGADDSKPADVKSDKAVEAAPDDVAAMLLMQAPVAAAVLNAASAKQDAAAPKAADAFAKPVAQLDVGQLGPAFDVKPLPAQQKNLPEAALPAQFLPAAPDVQQVAKAPPPVLTVQQPITDPNWSKALSQQVLTMVSMKVDKAEIQVNPPQMGPIEITLKMNGTDQAQVLFSAAVPATREALENNMHRLTSMLASSGIQLTDAQVSSGQSGQQQQQQAQQQRSQHHPILPAAEGEAADALTAIKAARGILSIFA